MQPHPQQQQVVVQQPGVMQPMYVTQPAPVVETYARRQSTVIGALLVIAGALSIIFNIVDLAVGTRRDYSNTQQRTGRYSYTSYNYYPPPTFMSLCFVGHGLWCGVLVSKSISNVIGITHHSVAR